MPGDKKLTPYQLSREHRELMTNLRISDEQTNGQPMLPPEQVELARQYLALILVDHRAEMAHVELLEEFSNAKFRAPLSRGFFEGKCVPRIDPAVGFRHNQLLPEARCRSVAEQGPGVLTDRELASLLLNPLALWDIADFIGTWLPDYWMEDLGKLGQEMLERYGLDFPIPGSTSP